MKRLFLSILMLSFITCSGNAQIFKKDIAGKNEKGFFGNLFGNHRAPKVKEPRAVIKARKKQEAKDKKLKRDYEKATKASQKRTIDIQTPEVQKRMKQNNKESASRDKAKKKKTTKTSKKAGKKYK